MVFHAFTGCAAITINFRTFYHFKNKVFNVCHFTITPLLPLAPDNQSLDLPVLDVCHQWNHTLCVFLCVLFSLSILFSGSVHVVASVRVSLLFTAE